MCVLHFLLGQQMKMNGSIREMYIVVVRILYPASFCVVLHETVDKNMSYIH